MVDLWKKDLLDKYIQDCNIEEPHRIINIYEDDIEPLYWFVLDNGEKIDSSEFIRNWEIVR